MNISDETLARIRAGEQVTLVVPLKLAERLAERLAARHSTAVLRRWQGVVEIQTGIAHQRGDTAMLERQQSCARILAAAVGIREFS